MSDCPVCGKPMMVNPLGKCGDPLEVCPVNNAAHAARYREIAQERKRLLAEAVKDDDPSMLAEIGAKTR